MPSGEGLYAQTSADVTTNAAFFSYLSDTITDRALVSDLTEVSVQSGLPTALAQQLRATVIKKNITLSNNAKQQLYLTFTTNNIYIKSRKENVKRILSGTVEVLIQSRNGTVEGQELVEYSFQDTINEDEFNRLTDNELTKPDQIKEAAEGLWKKIGIPAIILSGIGTATVLLFYVRG